MVTITTQEEGLGTTPDFLKSLVLTDLMLQTLRKAAFWKSKWFNFSFRLGHFLLFFFFVVYLFNMSITNLSHTIKFLLGWIFVETQLPQNSCVGFYQVKGKLKTDLRSVLGKSDFQTSSKGTWACRRMTFWPTKIGHIPHKNVLWHIHIIKSLYFEKL